MPALKPLDETLAGPPARLGASTSYQSLGPPQRGVRQMDCRLCLFCGTTTEYTSPKQLKHIVDPKQEKRRCTSLVTGTRYVCMYYLHRRHVSTYSVCLDKKIATAEGPETAYNIYLVYIYMQRKTQHVRAMTPLVG